MTRVSSLLGELVLDVPCCVLVGSCQVRPFKVTRWLEDGDVIHLDDSAPGNPETTLQVKDHANSKASLQMQMPIPMPMSLLK